MAYLNSDTGRPTERGMSLLELTLVLAALAITAAALTPAALRIVHERRQDAARSEMTAIYEAIVGDDEAGVYGYIGDMGRMPYELIELVERDDQPLFETSATTGLGTGWNGPYLTGKDSASEFGRDPWGNLYDIGVVGSGQLRSAGPNGLYDDADDLIYPATGAMPYGTLIVSIKGHSDDLVMTDPEGCGVILSYSNEGVLDEVIDETAPYSFETVHRGLHSVYIACDRFDGSVATEEALVAVRGGAAQQVTELHVDLGESPDADESSATDSEEVSDLMDSIGALVAPLTGQR